MSEKQKKPFFLYVAYNEPHGPMPDPPKKYMDAISSGCRNVDGYYGMIYGMDHGIGRILKKIEAMGELDNTIIFLWLRQRPGPWTIHPALRHEKGPFFRCARPGQRPVAGVQVDAVGRCGTCALYRKDAGRPKGIDRYVGF